ncbi:hypothetical protein QBC43DRAFT_359368 [Cladorrhinum sp. PSN259]|nr:hypothetical protein QBC43DRAFT_359368 [Cladorrhinum sp. PSN259]
MSQRLVSSAGSAIGSSLDGKVAFCRVSYKASTKKGDELRKIVGGYAVGIDPKSDQKLLLAVPNPQDMDGVALRALSWSAPRRHKCSTSLAIRADMTKEGDIDTTSNTTVITHPLTQDTSLSLVKRSLEFGYDSNTYHELATPSSVYNWEMGFHTVALLMERILATQQFNLAIEVSRLIFDPPLTRLDRCWRFIPCKSSKQRLADSVRDTIQRLAPGGSKLSEIADWDAHHFFPHPVARNRPAVYMKRFVMKSSELFGPAPVAIDPPSKPVVKSWSEIQHLVNDFATTSVDMELEFPHFINPVVRGGGARGH